MYVTLWAKISKLFHDAKRYMKDKLKFKPSPTIALTFVSCRSLRDILKKRV